MFIHYFIIKKEFGISLLITSCGFLGERLRRVPSYEFGKMLDRLATHDGGGSRHQ